MANINKKLLGSITLLAFVSFCAFYFSSTHRTEKVLPVYAKHIIIDGEKLSVELATTKAQRAQGLSGRANLLSDTGMLFVFSYYREHDFWMKDMLFPIDIIWFDQNNRVIYVEKNAPAPAPGTNDANLKIYGPQAPSQYVLEVAAGFADAHRLKIGDSIAFTD